MLGGTTIYAVIQTGGKQYKVSPGDTIKVELLPVESGSNVELDQVLLIADGDKVTIGSPTIQGAKVVATAVRQGKADKVIVFKYKSKVRSRRKKGHRQPYTELTIKEIVLAS